MGNKGCKKEEMAFQKDDKCAEVVHLLKGVIRLKLKVKIKS